MTATLTLREAFQQFLLHDLSAVQPSTIRAYRCALDDWEHLTSNPPIGRIRNADLSRFRTAVLEQPRQPATVNSKIRCLRVIFRRIGPPDSANPLGEGVIARIPYCKLLPEPRRIPRTASLEELDRIYAACEIATWPNCCGDIPPSEWWRAFVVCLYNIGPRRRDLQELKTSGVNFDAETVRYVARKTKKIQIVPLSRIVAAHLQAVWSERDLIFPGGTNKKSLYRQWKAIREVASITERLTFHDLRRTCGTAYANATGLDVASAILGHSISGVTAQFYVDPTERMRRAANELAQPQAFRSIFERQAYTPPQAAKVRRADWQFNCRNVTYRGHQFRLGQKPLAVLTMLVTAGRPVSSDALRKAV